MTGVEITIFVGLLIIIFIMLEMIIYYYKKRIQKNHMKPTSNPNIANQFRGIEAKDIVLSY